MFDGEVHGVTLKTVDGDPGVQIEMHTFVGSKAPWDHIGGSAPQFKEGLPIQAHPEQSNDAAYGVREGRAQSGAPLNFTLSALACAFSFKCAQTRELHAGAARAHDLDLIIVQHKRGPWFG